MLDAVAAGESVSVAYRDRSEANVRDISVSHLVASEWSLPATVHESGWRADFCPVNGPAIDRDGDTVAVAWFQGPMGSEEPAVWTALSNDGGRSFGPPVVMADDGPIGHVDVVVRHPDSALVSWLAGGKLLVRRVSESAAHEESLVVADGLSIEQGRPTLARLGQDVWLAWAEEADAGGLRLRRLAAVWPVAD
jgi:hypothetical protein